jgi:hypothetical protein
MAIPCICRFAIGFEEIINDAIRKKKAELK